MLVLAGALLIPLVAHADAVPPPPTDCPKGAIGDTSHVGTWCRPTTCTDPDKCRQPFVGSKEKQTFRCEKVGLCISTSSAMHPRGSPVIRREIASKTCSSDSDCSGKEKCVTEDRCVVKEGWKIPLIGSCALREGPAAPSAPTVLLLVIPLALVRRRRGRWAR